MRRMIMGTCYQILTFILLIPISSFGQEEGQLPQFAFNDSDGKRVSDMDFRNDRPLIIFYFEPTCTHCMQQAEWVAAWSGKLKSVDMLWVAWEQTDQLSSFQEQFFPQSQNTFFAVDTEQAFDNLFGFSQIPTVFVYDRKDQLLKKFKKETKMEKLLKPLGITQ